MVTIVLAVIGTVTGCTALLIQLLAFLADRARLQVSFSLTMESTLRNPKDHFRLVIILKNKGRRAVRIIEAGIEIPVKTVELHGRQFEATRFVQNLYNAREQPMIVLQEHGRHELTFEPFDARLLKPLSGNKANGFVIDSLDRRYDAYFGVPPRETFDKLLAKSESCKQEIDSNAGCPRGTK